MYKVRNIFLILFLSNALTGYSALVKESHSGHKEIVFRNSSLFQQKEVKVSRLFAYIFLHNPQKSINVSPGFVSKGNAADEMPPEIICRDTTLYLDENGEITIIPEDLILHLSDNISDSADITLTPATLNFSCANIGLNSLTVTAEDEAGNKADCIVKVTFLDKIPPVFTTVNSTLYLNSSGETFLSPEDVIANSFDNCSPSDSLKASLSQDTFTCEDIGTSGLTLTLTDESGNSSSKSLSVNVLDTILPVVSSSPEDIIIYNDPDSCGAVVNYAIPLFSDNCEGNNLTGILSEGYASGELFPIGSTTVTYSYEDAYGLNISSSFTVTVEDNESPVITEEASNKTVECDGNGNVLDLNNWLSAHGDALATDNCGPDGWTSDYDEGNWITDCGMAKHIEVTFTVHDASGNTNSTTATFRIQDTQAPVWKNDSTELDMSLSCSDPDGLIIANSLLPEAEDVCNATGINITKTPGEFMESDSCKQSGTYTHTFTATDVCGNKSDKYTQVIAIQDLEPPEWITAINSLNKTIQCSDTTGLIEAQALYPVAIDNCDDDLSDVEKTSGDFIPSGNCQQSGTFINTFIARDDCGNESQIFTQFITVIDTTAPIWDSAPGDLDRIIECSDTIALKEAQSLFPVASDNCDTNLTNYIKTPGAFVPEESCPQSGTYTNIFTVTDECGRVSKPYYQTITLIDTQPPEWETDATTLDRVIDCSDAVSISEAMHLFPIAHDNCDEDVSRLNKIGGSFIPSDSCSQAGKYINKWTVEDDCGNVSDTFTQVVTIQDISPPFWNTLPGDLNRTIECSETDQLNAAQLVFPIAEDLCDSDVTNITKISGEFVPDSCGYTGTYTNIFIVEDDCGNSSEEFIQTITLVDTQKPEFTVPPSIKICRDAFCNFNIDPSVTGDVTDEQDNCDTTLNAIYTDDLSSLSSCDEYGYILRVWSLEDNCGNKTTKYQVIIIEPTATVTLIPQADTLCFNENTSIQISSPTRPEFGLHFSYSYLPENPESVTITYTGARDNLDEGYIIEDNILNISDDAQKILLIVSPYITDELNNPICEGINDTTVLWVNPRPYIEVSYAPDTVLCDEDSIIFTGISGNGSVIGKWVYDIEATSASDFFAIEGEINRVVQDTTGIFAQYLKNTTDRLQWIEYTFTAKIKGVSQERPYCNNGETQTIRIWLNPIPHLIAIPEDTVYCDSSVVIIDIENVNGIVFGTSLYDVVVDYSEGIISSSYGNNSLNNTYPGIITDTLVNNSNTLQQINYILIPKIYKPVNNGAGVYCDKNGIVDTITIYLNPTPRISAILDRDTIFCDNSNYNLSFSSANAEYIGEAKYIIETSTTGNPGDITGLLNNGLYGEFPLNDMKGGTLINNTRDLKIINYHIKPVFRNVNGHTSDCDRGIDTTITIYLNPTPVFDSVSISDTIICNEDFVTFWFYNTQSTMGEVKYDFTTLSTQVTGIKNNAEGPFPLESYSDTLFNQSTVIREVEYNFTPVIHDETLGIYCKAGVLNTQVIEIVPTLKSTPEISEYTGGNNIRCYNDTTGSIRLNPEGGYYLGSNPYRVNWYKDGTEIDPETAELENIGAGEYRYSLTDIIGCTIDSVFILTQPDALVIQDSTKDITCSGYRDGEIFVQIGGGTEGYDLSWTGPNLFEKDIHLEDLNRDSLINAPEGVYYVAATDTNGCEIQKQIEIFPGLRVTIGLEPSRYGDYNISCNGLSNGSVIVYANGSGPTSDYSYDWSDEEGNPVLTEPNNKDIANMPSGIYNITVTDTAGCFESEQIELIQPDSLLISRTNDSFPGDYDISCYGYNNGDIQINISGGHSYLDGLKYSWSDTETGFLGVDQNISGLDTGTYRVEVTDSFNCFVSGEWTLTQPTQIQYTIMDSSAYNGYNISCNGFNDGFLNLDVYGSSNNFTYTWTVDSGTIENPFARDLSNAAKGHYSLFVSDTSYNCEANWHFSFKEPDTLSINPLLSMYNGYNTSCYESQDGSITLNPEGGVAPYRYSWATSGDYEINDSSENQTEIGAGLYQLELSDQNNCLTQWNIEITEPEKLVTSLIPSSTSCYGDSTGGADLIVEGGVPEYTYLWSNQTTEEDLSGVPTGEYSVIITDANSCNSYGTVTVPEPPEIIIRLEASKRYNGSVISCYGENDGKIISYVSGGTGDYSYEWLPTGDSTRTIVNLSSGMYTVRVRDELFCSAVDSLEIEDPLPLKTSIYANNPSCYGYSDGKITVIPQGGTIQGDYNISWPGLTDTGQEADSIPAGNYRILIKDLNECQLDTSVNLINPDSAYILKDIIQPDCPDIYNGEINLTPMGGTPPFSFEWDNSNTGNYLDNLVEGTYIVRISDFNRCVMMDTTILSSINESCLEIPTAFTPNGDGINDIWEIVNIDLYPESVMEIYNRWGKLLYQVSPYFGNEWDGTFNGRNLPLDSYHFVLKPAGNRKTITGNVTLIK